jgi:hypothetical protein
VATYMEHEDEEGDDARGTFYHVESEVSEEHNRGALAEGVQEEEEDDDFPVLKDKDEFWDSRFILAV